MTERLQKPRRWITPLLVASLAFNLMIVGIVVGWALSPDGPRKERRDVGAVRGLVGEPFARALPAEDRRALLQSAVEDRDRLRENKEALSRRFAEFLAALEAEEFDPERLRSLLSEQRDAAIRRQEIGEDFLIERLSVMTRDDRVAYAERLREQLKNLRPRSGRD